MTAANTQRKEHRVFMRNGQAAMQTPRSTKFTPLLLARHLALEVLSDCALKACNAMRRHTQQWYDDDDTADDRSAEGCKRLALKDCQFSELILLPLAFLISKGKQKWRESDQQSLFGLRSVSG